MISDETLLGRHRQTPIGEMSDRAARAIAANGGPVAVTVDPDGRVWMEPPGWEVEDELVGVYAGASPFTLERVIDADLRHVLGGAG